MLSPAPHLPLPHYAASGTAFTRPSVRISNMSPENALVEFISASASFHSVKRMSLTKLEADILNVGPNNIMPANAAAWYMGKKRFYEDWQLLPAILRNYPKRFAISGNGRTIEFLDDYCFATARKKLRHMVRQGLVAYFTHKIDDYGVYFFDPMYYATTEPFRASFDDVLCGGNGDGSGRGAGGKMVEKFFALFQDQFVFQKINDYLVTISREPVEVKVNVTCVVTSMIDNQFGTLRFGGDDDRVEQAYFSAKSLYKDGYVFNGDPKELPRKLGTGRGLVYR